MCRNCPLISICCCILLAACSSSQPLAPPPKQQASPTNLIAPAVAPTPRNTTDSSGSLSADAMEVVLYALGLLNIDYRFGGANPESGLDCSGMVSYIYRQATGIRLPHNAAQIAQLGREIGREQLEPGDLVFFNTRNKPFSHVGIYIGDEKFVHAPATNGQIKVSSLKNRYFAVRYEGGRRYLN